MSMLLPTTEASCKRDGGAELQQRGEEGGLKARKIVVLSEGAEEAVASLPIVENAYENADTNESAAEMNGKEEKEEKEQKENCDAVEEEEALERKGERKGSSVILRIKRYPGLSVTVQYAEDVEDVEFERHESFDQTESSDSDEEVEGEEDDEEEDDRVVVQQPPSTEFARQWLKLMLERTRRQGGAATADDGGRKPSYSAAEGLFTVDGDYDTLFLPQLENARVQANRSILINRMAQTALAMKLPPSGMYLAVLLLDFYWGHDRAMGRRMDSVQLQVLSYTCLYVGSNRFSTPGRTPDEFCRWVGVAQGSVKGCMIVRQLEALGTILKGPEKVSSVTSQSLWLHMSYLDPEVHMSKFIRHLENSEYGRSYFTPAVLKDAHDVKGQPDSTTTSMEYIGKVMKNRLLMAANMSARNNKRSSRDASVGNKETATNKPAKMMCLQKIAVL